MALLNSTQQLYHILYTTLHCLAKCAVLTLLWIPIYIYRCLLTHYIKIFQPSFGKILNSCESAFEENYSERKPSNTMIFSFVLEGPIELQHLRTIFQQNILEAKIPSPQKDDKIDQLIYPTLKQYQVEFGGYRFWKDDPYFNIANHITERLYIPHPNFLTQTHQQLINKLYPKNKSPWELVLIKNYLGNPNKCVLFSRSHHTLGDTKSLLKMFFECLSKKPLPQPPIQYPNNSLLQTITYYALLPFYIVYTQIQGEFTIQLANHCPWKYLGSDDNPTNSSNVAISKKISLESVKSIAKHNNVTTSAVIMAAIAGGIQKCDPRLAGKPTACKWVLPKANHPDILACHSYSASIEIPTDIPSSSSGLKKCNEIVIQMKTSNLPKYAKCWALQMGTWVNPWRKSFVRHAIHPVLVTNIAGGTEEFRIDGTSSRCSELTMTCGHLGGIRGLLICAFSYMDQMDITVTARDAILTANQTQNLATLIEREFNHLNIL